MEGTTIIIRAGCESAPKKPHSKAEKDKAVVVAVGSILPIQTHSKETTPQYGQSIPDAKM
jgi:hypothetical protein